MGKRSFQIIKPQKLNLDTAYEELKQDESTFLKNVISEFNQGINNSGANQNSSNLTPIVSNVDYATFNYCIVTYTWDMASTIAAFPRNRLTIDVNGTTYGSGIHYSDLSSLQEIVDVLNGFNVGVFIVSGTNIVTQSATNTYGILFTDNTNVINPAINITPTTNSACANEGNNICIGSKYDRRLNQFFWFNWNSENNHNFWVYDANTNIATVIWVDALFNFSQRFLITSIDVVIADISTSATNMLNEQRLIYWTDGNNEPRKMNVDIALAGGYAGLTFLRSPDEFMNQTKYPPLDVDISNTLTNPDTTYLLNYVANKEFQFRYRYKYQDGEFSTWSAISTYAFSVDTNRNFIELNMSVGSSLVTYVELAFRETNIGDWKSYDNIKRTLITANVTYAYNSTTNIFIYKFFNNQQYNILDQTSVNTLFSLVPLKSQAQAFVEENVLLHGSPLEGYDNFSEALLAIPTVSVTYGNIRTGNATTLTLTISLFFTWSAGTININVHHVDAITGVDTIINNHTITGAGFPPLVYTVAINPIAINDRVYLAVSGGTGSIDNLSTLHGVYSNTTYPNWDGTVGNFLVTKLINQASGAVAHITFEKVNSDPLLTWNTSTNEDVVPAYAIAFPQLKQGGSYKLGIVGYDDELRSSTTQLFLNGNINIESIQANESYQSQLISVNWNNAVFPDWVKRLKVVRTKNTTIDRSIGQGYLQFGIGNIEFLKADGTVGTPAVKMRFSINVPNKGDLIQYNTDNYNNTTTTYTWTQGDRIQFIRNGDGAYYGLTNYKIIDQALSTDPANPDVTFICDFNPSLSNIVDGAWVQFYTPAKQEQTDIFYEIGDFIPTTGQQGNNQASVAYTLLKTFDTYPIQWKEPYVENFATDSGATPFEHHSIYKTIVPSSGEDIGRINVINVSSRQLWYPARIRRSNAYLPQGNLNGLSQFDDVIDVDYKDYNRAKGGIVQLCDDGYKLFVLQQDGCFIVMMAKQLVTLADGGNQLVATSIFFSDPIQLQGIESGCQNSESFVESEEGLLLWIDAKRGIFAACDWQEIKDISREGNIKSYAEAKLKALYLYNQQEYLNQTCCYDATGMPDLTSQDTFAAQVNGNWIYLRNISITDANSLAQQLTILGYGLFTGDNLTNQVCTVGNQNIFGDVVFFHPSTVYEWDLSDIVGSPFSETNTTIVINGVTISTSQTFDTITDFVNYLNTLGYGFFSEDSSVLDVTDCTNTYGNITVNNGDDTIPPDSFASDSALCEAYYTVPIACNIDFWTIPCGIEPKHKHYVTSFFRQLTKNVYYYNVPTFSTGSIIISISVDMVLQQGTFTISTFTDIIAAINTLIDDTAVAIQNDTVVYIISSSGSVYAQLTIDMGIHSAQTNDKFSYINNEYAVNINVPETIAYSLRQGSYKTFRSAVPEFFDFCDSQQRGLSMIEFKNGIPWFNNLATTTTYDQFFTYKTDQIIAIVCNEAPQIEKRFTTVEVNSKSNTSSISSIAYSGYTVKTSDSQYSTIPLAAFTFKESRYFAVFYRDLSLNLTLQTGAQLRGNWLVIYLLRDTDSDKQTIYNELSKVVINFFTSEYSK